MDGRAQVARPVVAETGEIFYYLGGNNIVSHRLSAFDNNGRFDQLVVPARDVLHIRLHSNERNPSPLIGESPLLAVLDDLEMYDAIKRQQGGVFSPNEARAEEDLPAIEYGVEPRVQMQVVPLSAAGSIPCAPGPEAPPAPIPRQLTKAQHLGDLKAIRRRVAEGR